MKLFEFTSTFQKQTGHSLCLVAVFDQLLISLQFVKRLMPPFEKFFRGVFCLPASWMKTFVADYSWFTNRGKETRCQKMLTSEFEPSEYPGIYFEVKRIFVLNPNLDRIRWMVISRRTRKSEITRIKEVSLTDKHLDDLGKMTQLERRTLITMVRLCRVRFRNSKSQFKSLG